MADGWWAFCGSEKFDFPVTKETLEHLLQIKRILFTFTFSLQSKGTVNCFEKSN